MIPTNRIPPVKRLISFPHRCSLLVPWLASPTSNVGSDKAIPWYQPRTQATQLWDPEAAVLELGGAASSPSSACIAFRDWRASAKLVRARGGKLPRTTRSSEFQPDNFRTDWGFWGCSGVPRGVLILVSSSLHCSWSRSFSSPKTLYFENSADRRNLRSTERGPQRVYSGCFALFWTRENAGKTLQQHFERKNRRNPGKKKRENLKNIKMPKNRRGIAGKKKEKNKDQDGWPRRLVLVRATPRAEVDIISAQLGSCARAIFPCLTLFWSARSLPLMIVDNSPNMHTTGLFPDGYLLSVTDGSIWIPYLARYLQTLMKPNFQVVKWESTFIWKMPLSQAELETEGSCLATMFGSPPNPRLAVKCKATCRCCGRVVALFKRVNCREQTDCGREISSSCVPWDFTVWYMISGI